MRRTLIIALGMAVALATAALAFAVVPSVVGVSVATATFSTNKIEKSKTRTCTADTKTWQITDGHYTGTVTSLNAVLAGSLAIHARTTYNTTDKLGYVEGSFRVKDDDSRVRGKFSGTINDGKLVGFLTGKSHGNHAKVLGNLSAAFAGDNTNFTDGQLGSVSNAAVLAVVAGPACKAPKSDKPGKRVHVKGVITGLAAGPPATITVTPKHGPAVTCTIDTVYAVPAGFPLNTKDVEMKCEWVGTAGVLTLRKLEK